ncbi:putative metal-nicotianamine transporter YSL14 [Apostasia shenzhenica]|uniref:Putative metal-nicotianamine transporter YSL14 n=1 Tax=Apostasia shenzhenica TaxID=1088818 RepID=A0A2I0A999_9ASPA|nr:putative metal-nicotianamine transporter YSL14 [Apostasia shenzhenica]
MSVERTFECEAVPTWREQLTVRSFAVSAVLGFFLSFIVMKLNLTTGIIPSLNVSAGLLGFFFVKSWTKILEKSGLLRHPFTRQENTVIQTCVVACYGIAFSGGFGSYILGMSSRIANQQDQGPSTAAINTKEPSLPWLIGFLFTVSFVGLFSVVPLRKIMIIGYKLTYPSGTATAHLINSFHTPHGANLAKKQVVALFKSFIGSFLWAFFQWFYTAGDDCGFANFPTFGLSAYDKRFYFDFSATYVGVGMICPYIINASILLGGIISYGILWPFIETKSGIWYSADLKRSDMRGLQGYKVFISIAIILGDGLFNFLAVAIRTAYDISRRKKQQSDASSLSFDEIRRTKMFLQDQIPTWLSILGYLILAAVSVVVVPHIFPQLRFYHVIVMYLIAPVLAFCNSYGCGLTDWSLASNYGKLGIFVFCAWVGVHHGGIVAGLAACGVMMSIVSTASDLMQDFKTGYLTLSSPRSMFFSQVLGTAMGCVFGPCVFWIFYKAFPLGSKGSEYPAPYAAIYRAIAMIGVQGTSALPANCLILCLFYFLMAVLLDLMKVVADRRKWRIRGFIPNPMAMAIPFYIGSYFAIDMCVGSLILFVWQKMNKRQADAFAPSVASGMICGDGIWALPSAILSLAKVKPPMCMKFFSGADYAKLGG